MSVIGIDLSLTATGCIVLDKGKIVRRQLIKTKPTDNIRKELERLFEIRDSIDIADVKLAVIEGLAFLARNTTALVQLAALNYLVRERFYLDDIPFVIVAPTSLKKFITGKGNAAKDAMLLETYKRYGVSFTNDNICDAYGLSRIGEALVNSKIKITKIQKEVINLLKKQL